jgi:hypothetical protein
LLNNEQGYRHIAQLCKHRVRVNELWVNDELIICLSWDATRQVVRNTMWLKVSCTYRPLNAFLQPYSSSLWIYWKSPLLLVVRSPQRIPNLAELQKESPGMAEYPADVDNKAAFACRIYLAENLDCLADEVEHVQYS